MNNFMINLYYCSLLVATESDRMDGKLISRACSPKIFTLLFSDKVNRIIISATAGKINQLLGT